MNRLQVKTLRWNRILLLFIPCLAIIVLIVIGIIHFVANNDKEGEMSDQLSSTQVEQDETSGRYPPTYIDRFYSQDVLRCALEEMRVLEYTYGFPNINEEALELKLKHQYRMALNNESGIRSYWPYWADEYVHENIVIKIVELDDECQALQVYNSQGELLSDLSHLSKIVYEIRPTQVSFDENGMPVFVLMTEYGKVSGGPSNYGVFNWRGDDLTGGERYREIRSGNDNIIALWNPTVMRGVSGMPQCDILGGWNYHWEHETTYIDTNGNVLLGPIAGCGIGSFHNGYAAIQFTGDINTSYINLDGEALFRDRVFEYMPQIGSATLSTAVRRTDIHMFHELLPGTKWDDLVDFSFAFDTKVVTFDGEPATLSRDCDPMMDEEYCYIGVWEIDGITIWLGDDRCAFTDDDGIEYTWAVFNPYPSPGYPATLILQSGAGENRFFTIDTRFHELSESYHWYMKSIDWTFRPLEYEIDTRDSE